MTMTLTSGRGRNGRDAADCDKLDSNIEEPDWLQASGGRDTVGWLS